MFLCRFHTPKGVHVGVVKDEGLYDLTIIDPAKFSTMTNLLCWTMGLKVVADALWEVVSGRSPHLSVKDAMILKPLDEQEVWGAGVTYQRSRAARMREAREADIYSRVYDAQRPEVFFKATAERVVGHGEPVRVRSDSKWSVPEPELTLVLNPSMELIGFTAGNDMSARDIEGENPLYLPQAKTYRQCCAIGPMIRLMGTGADPESAGIRLTISRGGQVVFEERTSTTQMARSLSELISYLARENEFPKGVFFLTGTGIVPPDDFSLQDGDHVSIEIEGVGVLENPVVKEAR
jgi:2-dehydro-3-deoxy-D-arabinonate dehydratase